MDDRELDLRLKYIEEKVTNIEAVIQQYWSDIIGEKEQLNEVKESGGKKVRIARKSTD